MGWLDRLLARWLARRMRRTTDRVENELKADTLRCISDVEERWRYYNSVLKYKSEVSLAEIIEGFAIPVTVFIEKDYPRLCDGRLIWMMIFKAVQNTQTHPQDELNAAVAALQQKYLRNAPVA